MFARRCVSLVAKGRAFSTGKYTVPQLAFGYDALTPFIEPRVMEVHHSKHHATYVANLNNAMDQLETAVAKKDGHAITTLENVVKFNYGGHYNHSMFWENLSPPKSNPAENKPTGDLAAAIDNTFGSFDAFKTQFQAKTVGVQGSGWGWLVQHKGNKGLSIMTTSNQDLLPADVEPLMVVDVWEHAYYLQYENRRPDFLSAIWNVLNWETVGTRFTNANK